MGAERESTVRVSGLLNTYASIQPQGYAKTLGAFLPCLGGEGRGEGGLKTNFPESLCVAAIFRRFKVSLPLDLLFTAPDLCAPVPIIA
jgi:hypothetical protein